MRFRALSSAVLLGILAQSCAGADKGDSTANAPAPASGAVAHRDPRLSAPSFVWLNRADAPSFSTASEAADALKPTIAQAFGVDASAPIAFTRSTVPTRGPVMVRYEQSIGDIEVFRGGVNVMLSPSLRAIAAAGFLAPSASGTERPFVIGPEDALAASAQRLGGVPAFRRTDDQNGYQRYAAPGLSAPARVKKVWFPVRADGTTDLEPAYYTELIVTAGPARGWVVSAVDGRVLFEKNLIHNEAFTYRVYADPETKWPTPGPEGNAINPHPTGTPDKRKLTMLPSQLVTLANYPYSKNDPWLPSNATTTQGNNVFAYADIDDKDGYDDGDPKPALTSALTFDTTYDTNAAPNATPASTQAAITHLFYVTNFLHDWFYDAGFDEASGNHQKDNLGRGGKGGDPLMAEAQDSSGRNNANALVPPDGQSPRMQMFVFSGASSASLVVAAPSPAAGTKTVGIASGFGKDNFDINGTVVLAVDGGADPADGCEAPTNDLTGKIALVHRGTCSFVQKAQIAQDAGAIGLIIANVASSANPTQAPFMGGQVNGLTIPVLSLSLADGQALENALTSEATVTMKRTLESDLDGALDTTIVAHEWGHVLSNRLVGDGMGLMTNQAGGLGEGWGDFTALLTTIRADDATQYMGTYANGAYATSGSGDDVYFGTRRVPYSIDFTKNALTLKHISGGVPLPTGVATSYGEDGSFNAEVHSTGEVWATMLWECYASLLRSGRLSFTEAQDRMKRYLVASLKLTPVDPTIIEARDAVLAAALATDQKDFDLFWAAFARRGAGAGAIGPAKDSSDNGGVTESFEVGNDLQIIDAKFNDDVISCDHDGILDEGEVGTVEITVRNTGSGALKAPTAQLSTSTPGVTLLDTEIQTLPELAPFATNRAKLKARVKGQQRGVPIAIDVAVTDPGLPATKVVKVAVPTRYDSDLAKKSSAIDHVDTMTTVWKVNGEGDGAKWARTTESADGFWTIPDPMQNADHKLISPKFTIDDKTFGLSFKHQWSFKISTRRQADVDGGVVEISLDQGLTWTDISKYGDLDYNTTLLDDERFGNPLSGRKAYGNTSAGYPDQWVTSHIDVKLPQHPEYVMLRFRMGAAFGRASFPGWSIDDIELTDTSAKPFPSYVPQADDCDPAAPTVDAGLPQVVKPRDHVGLVGTASDAKNLPLTYLWSQEAGPEVALKDDGTLTPSFDAPDVTEPTTLTFALRAHDGSLLSKAARVDVIVDPSTSSSVKDGCGCRTTPATNSSVGIGAALLGLAGLFGRRRRVSPS